MWQSPWDNSVPGGDQVAQAMWAIATGGRLGTGLGLGDSRYLPAGHTDLVLAAVGEELGASGLIAVAVVFGVMAWRGLAYRAAAPTDYGFFLSVCADAVPGRAGLRHGCGRCRRDPADRRGHAVSQLRRLGDGREFRGAGHAVVDPLRSTAGGRSPIVRRPASLG